MIPLELGKADWEALRTFIEAANEAREAIRRAVGRGSQQVSVKNEAVHRFLEQDVPPVVWLKLGGLLADVLKDPGT